MIYTVTLNPSLDYIVRMDKLTLGEINRADYEQIKAGGKGINVSIVLHNLGHDSVALGFVAGFTGDEIRREMHSARWTAFALGYQCAWAYIVAFLTYSIGTLCTGGGFGTAQTVACALALGLLCLIFRPMPQTKS